MNKTSRARFLRTATSRTKKCIKAIRLLANCSNRATYEWLDDEVGQIFGRLASELERAQKMFEPYTSPIAFRLSTDEPRHACRYCGREGASRRSNISHETACPSRTDKAARTIERNHLAPSSAESTPMESSRAVEGGASNREGVQ